MGPWWAIIYWKFWNWLFEPDKWELITEDSEISLSFCINEYLELFTHFCVKFSLKLFEDWDFAFRDLPFTSFGKYSFKRLQLDSNLEPLNH